MLAPIAVRACSRGARARRFVVVVGGHSLNHYHYFIVIVYLNAHMFY